MRIFGTGMSNVDYFVRKGAYAVIFSEEDPEKVALIRAHGNQYFLPGGGIESGETDEQCLRRELLEETGHLIDTIQYLGHAQRYFLSTLPVVQPMINDGYFYTARFGPKIQTPVEPDNFLEWVDVQQSADLMFHEHQAWAIQKALDHLKNRP
ncbi:NUDIX domain-containing protein [Sporolactobacillus kofuensis]|uniref:NUDIX domain-containing protein n=1 Tax=Sporolactobacillus kofuensis TaxID=269672 RepID=A0ABW1WGD3_9BACL|nr:NUDIX domain-containing protein [Sporolactobacillus kofuensis]MCO7175448.1 NUDIX domain-containing protein [Sporolactobacillus kofuensis]